MSWQRVESSFLRQLKVQSIEPEHRADAVALWLGGLCWAGEYLTDGLITDAALVAISAEIGLVTARKRARNGRVRDPETVANELVRVGLWDPTSAGFRIHNYHDFNPTAAEVKEARNRDAKRKRQRRAQLRMRADDSDVHGSVQPDVQPDTREDVRSPRAPAHDRAQTTPTTHNHGKALPPPAAGPPTSPSTTTSNAARHDDLEEPAAGEPVDLAAAIEALPKFDRRSWEQVAPAMEGLGTETVREVLNEVKSRRHVDNPVGLFVQRLRNRQRDTVRAAVEALSADQPKSTLAKLHDDPEAYVRQLGWKMPDDVLDEALSRLLPEDEGRRFELANLAADLRRAEPAA